MNLCSNMDLEISDTLGLDHFPGLGLGLENPHFPGLGLGLSLEYS